MALIKCPECQKEMSDTLETCPHCGFIIKKPEIVKNQKTIEENERSPFSSFLYVVILVILGIAILNKACTCDKVSSSNKNKVTSSSQSSDSSNYINAGVRFSNNQIMITNNDSATWTNTNIKINDDYKYTIGTMSAGETKIINMSECSNASGDRFNPYVKKFQNIYISSDKGYFYSSTK